MQPAIHTCIAWPSESQGSQTFSRHFQMVYTTVMYDFPKSNAREMASSLNG